MAKANVGKYLTPKVIVNLSILLGFLIFAAIVISFLGREIKGKADRIGEQRAEIESRINSISRLAELNVASREAEPALARLNSLLPKRDELVAFPRYLDTLAASAGVTQTFSFKGDAVSPTGSEAGHSSFSLSVGGPYADILKFLENLEKGRFIVRVDSLDVVLQRDNVLFKADIQGVIFFRD